METLIFENCRCCIYSCDKSNAPVVYIPVFTGHGEDLIAELNKKPHKEINLIAIADINWSQDMAPFCMPALTTNSSACLGGAKQFLDSLTQTVIPQTETNLELTPEYRVLCGYSLAGLFSLYALHYTELFLRAGSFSGSLWLPQFEKFLKSTELKITPERIYLSLGDQEKKCSNPLLQTIEDKTIWALNYYQALGIKSAFELNNGGHDHNVAWRCARGIIALTSKKTKIFDAP